MGILEQITQLKNKNLPDEEIIKQLTEQGITPKEITDALEQSKIKSAVNAEQSTMETPTPEKQTPLPIEETQIPTLEESQPQEQISPQMEQQGYIQPNYQETPDAYSYPPEQQTYSQTNTTSTDTMIEIAEQVFSEKIKSLENQTNKFKEFKTLSETKLEDLSERLKRIENTIDKLQIAILEKIGSYGTGISTIKKEMSMMQDSFNKLVNHKIKNPSNSKKISKKK